MRKSKLYKYRSKFRIIFWLAIVVSYTAAILPQDIAPQISTMSDKAHHVFAFMVLGLLLRFSYCINYWYALLLLVGYGAFIEFSQIYTETRHADFKDIVADLIGSFVGLKLYKYLQKR